MARASSNSKVKKAAKASSAKPTKKNSTQAEKLRAIALPELREELKNQVGNDAPKIVTSLIDAAAKGSCGHAKYLFEMIGLYPAAALDQEDLEEDSLAKTLLPRLGLPEDPILETEVRSEGASQDTGKGTEDSKPERLSSATDAVE